MNNLVTIVSKPKETILGAVNRATYNSSLYGKVVQLQFGEVKALVYPHENKQSIDKLVSHVTLEDLKHQFKSLKKK